MKKYAIWDKKTPIYGGDGKIYTPEEWIDKYPIAGCDTVTVLCSSSVVNGAIFGVLEQKVLEYEAMGCDFSACKTNEEKLAVIEDFDEAKAIEEAEVYEDMKSREQMQADSLASIAASLEYQNMLTLDDVEV